MRNMMKDPNYKNQQYLLGKKPELKVIAVEEIMNYNLSSAEKEFLCDLTVSTVLQTTQWFRNICTSCYEDTYSVDNLQLCKCIGREVPYPLKWFKISLLCIDGTRKVEIKVGNVAGQKLYKANANNLFDPV
ncbi:uncharacterized protein LOC141714928 [Apium graveolens]|uniref:uncharacterized protein LOC141714928 n=1 Tax=Apium graveolens TaxID=4045 RepID=UPI003D7B8DEB